MIIVPTPIAPMYITDPRWPIITLSTKPTKGIVILDIIKGMAIFKVLRSIEDMFSNYVAYVISIISKSSLPAPQSGHAQFSGTFSHFVPGSIPSSGHP